MIRARDIDTEAERLSREAEEMDAAISAGDLRDSQIIAARRALCEPREKAADLLRQAADALRAIPPLGLTIGQGKTA